MERPGSVDAGEEGEPVDVPDDRVSSPEPFQAAPTSGLSAQGSVGAAFHGGESPLLRRWWFWVAIVGALGAVGLGTGLGLGLPPDGPGEGDVEVHLP